MKKTKTGENLYAFATLKSWLRGAKALYEEQKGARLVPEVNFDQNLINMALDVARRMPERFAMAYAILFIFFLSFCNELILKAQKQFTGRNPI